MKLPHRLCLLALCTVFVLPAAAAGNRRKYPDLSENHWAYEDMDEAAELGIIKGMEDGRMAPEDALTWGQYLTMLTRTFYPDTYATLLEAGVNWDQSGYWSARDRGLIGEEDILSVDPANLGAPILRQDAAVLLDRALPEDISGDTIPKSYGWFWDEGYTPSRSPEETFSDYSSLSAPQQKALKRLYALDIIRGREDGAFGGAETIRRADGTVLLLRTFYKADGWTEKDMTVTLHIVDQQGESMGEDQVAEARTGWYAHELVDESMLWHYVCLSVDRRINSLQTEYTMVYRPFTRFEAAEEEFWAAVERGELTWDDYWKQEFHLWAEGENPAKYLLLFGNGEQRRFPDRATAETHMTTVTIPVWRLDKRGNKVPATASFSIHTAIAEDTVALFTEIYNDPEQFPIHDLGGYGWRGDKATGEHNCGTAVDINANENYQIRDGKVLVGSLWAPGENPYSIGPDSSVVRIFREHGWSWGGDAWADNSDASYGYHDYMHLSYMGK